MEYKDLKFEEVVKINEVLMNNLNKDESIELIKASITYLDEIIRWYDENWNSDDDKKNKANTCILKDYYVNLLNGINLDNEYIIERCKRILRDVCYNWMNAINQSAVNKINIEDELNKVILELKNNVYDGNTYLKMGQLFEMKNSFNRAYLCYEQASALSQNNNEYENCISEMLRLRSSYDIKVKNISIIILAHNDLDYLKVCIQSIRNNNLNSIYEIVVIDNNSTDGTIEWLNEQEDIKYLISNNYNGIEKVCNENNDIFFLSSDSIALNNSIFDMRMALYSKDEIGAVGGCSNLALNNQQIRKESRTFDEEIEFAERNNIPDETRYEEKIKLSSFAFMVKREVVNEVGWIDDRFTPQFFSDDDYSFRISNAGYKLILANDSYVYSFQNILKDQDLFNELFFRNSKLFSEKWGFSSEYSSNIRQDLIKLINEDKNKELNVLEVGCACGASLLKIKNLYPNSNLYGIEFNENSASIAKHFAKVDAYDIEAAELNYNENSFDYIIFGDVLEHLKDPSKVIVNMKRYLKEDGSLLISLPNIMHYSVIFPLLNGNFTYEDAGILDRTHLKFFTKNEIIKMVSSAGYNIDLMMMKSVGDSEEIDEKINEIMNLSFVTSSLKEEFKTYQYIVKADKISDK